MILRNLKFYVIMRYLLLGDITSTGKCDAAPFDPLGEIQIAPVPNKSLF